MEDHVNIPEESMRHIEALLARHPPQMIQRMFSQTLESRKSRIALVSQNAELDQVATPYHLLHLQIPQQQAQLRLLGRHGDLAYR